MTLSIYPYYEQELHFIRREAEEFAKQHPAAAGELLLERNQSRDPHVERLIEGFALLAARVEKKLDDEFSEVSDGMLAALYPHYLAPIPSMAIVEFEPDAASPQPAGLHIPRGTRVRSQPIDGVPCRFRTCFPVDLWPIQLRSASLETPPFDQRLKPPADAAAVLRLSLQAEADLHFSQLALDAMRFHLHGDDPLMAKLYEGLFTRATRVDVYADDGRELRVLASYEPHDALAPVGFGEQEGLLPYPETSHQAYRLLTELFAFPEKYFFFDLRGLRPALASGGARVDVVIFLSRVDARLAAEVTASTFRLGCAPVVNLFEKVCEPIRLTHAKTEYPVLPDLQRRQEHEIYSVERVTATGPDDAVEYFPLYGLNHENSWHESGAVQTYWHARRRPSSSSEDGGTDVSLRLVDLGFDPAQPADRSVTVHAQCTNRDLPNRIPPGAEGLRFEMDSAIAVKSVRCLRQPTSPLRPALGKRGHWRLISHLSLNHLSLSGGPLARSALVEMLRLYEFTDASRDRTRAIVNSQMIDGVVGVAARPTVCRIGGLQTGGFCRGTLIDLELDEDRFRTVGYFVFASVLERFFAQYATINSFTQLSLRTRQSGHVKTWPPRSGDRTLL